MNESILKLQGLLDRGCRIEKIYPGVTASDAEINISNSRGQVSDGQIHKIRAYREEANDLREFIRTEL